MDADDLQVIEMKAKALTLEECYDFLCVDPSELGEKEAAIAKKVWRKGRVEGISTAVDRMFSSMATRGGGDVALNYLQKMSSSFSATEAPSASGGFSFEITIPEPEAS